MGSAEVWIVSILSTLVGAAISAVLGHIVRIVQFRRGSLAGNWYSVTYSSEDPGMTGEPWSIEWIEVRHHGQTVTGTMWRIYKAHFNRRWSFRGRYEESEILGYYRATRGEGGRGNFALMALNNWFFKGGFQERQVLFEAIQSSHCSSSAGLIPISIGYFGMPLVWIRVGSSAQERIVPCLCKISAEEVAPHVPRRVHKKLKRVIANLPLLTS
jgi:hypothetical protein